MNQKTSEAGRMERRRKRDKKGGEEVKKENVGDALWLYLTAFFADL